MTDDRAEWLAECARAHRDAQRRERRAAAMLSATITAAHDGGMSMRAIGALVGLSHQRVSQLITKGRGDDGRAHV